MKLVIDLPEKEYQNVMRGRWEGNPLAEYIENGTPFTDEYKEDDADDEYFKHS